MSASWGATGTKVLLDLFGICSAWPNICRTTEAKIPAKFSTHGDFVEKNGPKPANIPAKFSTHGDFVEKNGPKPAKIPAKFSTRSDFVGNFRPG